MASVGNGTAIYSLLPRVFSGSQATAFDERQNYLMSVNSPIRYQILYKTGSASFKENSEPSVSDVVNVIFKVYGTSIAQNMGNPTTEWQEIATIRKSRDVPNKGAGGIPIGGSIYYNEGHRFTIDISSICNDLLSYSLCPIGKGTWARHTTSPNTASGIRGSYGGMNGNGHPEDNDIQQISNTLLTQNGAYRYVKLEASFELLQADGTVATAVNGNTPITMNTGWIAVINSAPQWEEDSVYYSGTTGAAPSYAFDRTASTSRAFLSKCPNFSTSSGSGMEIKKDVQLTDEAEWLYFFVHKTLGDSYIASNLTFYADAAMLQVTTSDGSTVYLNDFRVLLEQPFGQFVNQNRYCVQNVSPDYIANNAVDINGSSVSSPFTANTEWYSVRYINRKNTNSAVIGMSEFRHYKIDRETEHPFGYVRFHWLNRMGGIDSYTAKRNVIEGISVSKNTFESKSPDKMWIQKGGLPVALDDSVRGDLYRGGREVLNIEANRNHSVYTDPLNKATAKWLEELITSPNVWIEYESDATKRLNALNSQLRPSTKTYIPVVLTNSDVETVNQESGLVKFNIEFTHSHSINTQRN